MADPQDTKFQKSVNKATGGESMTVTKNDVAVGKVGSAAAMVGTADPTRLEGMIASDKWEFAPQNVTLDEGQFIEGILEGVGPGNDFTNDDGQPYHVDSWVITSPDGNMRASILSSAQLDRKLPPFIGAPVYIQRGKDLKMSNGHRCTDYIVGGAKIPGGSKRTFSTHKPTPRALPAGGEIADHAGHAAAQTANANSAPREDAVS